MLVRIQNLYCVRGSGKERFTVHVPDLTITPGELIAITGVSGSGKSTLLEVLGLILSPQLGSSLVWEFSDEKSLDIAMLWQHNSKKLDFLRRTHLGFVLQTGGLLPFLTVADNIRLPRQLLHLTPWLPELDVLVEQLHISQLMAKKPSQLSIGERQRVAIARALAHQPALLLADEPTSALDPQRAEAVMQLFVALMKDQRRTAVIVTHDYAWIDKLGLREVKASVEKGGEIVFFS